MRLIDADELIERWAFGMFDTDEGNILQVVAKKAIEDMPTIESAPVWTPCADGLPEEGKPCYITVVRTDKDGSEHRYVVYGCFVKGAWFDGQGWKIESKGVYSWNMVAAAWKLYAVPEPYNPDKKEK